MTETSPPAAPPAAEKGDADMIYHRLGEITEQRGANAGHTAALALATLALAFIADRNGPLVALVDIADFIHPHRRRSAAPKSSSFI